MSVIRNYEEIENGVWYRVQHHQNDEHEDETFVRRDGHPAIKRGKWTDMEKASVIVRHGGRFMKPEIREFSLHDSEFDDGLVSVVSDEKLLKELDSTFNN